MKNKHLGVKSNNMTSGTFFIENMHDMSLVMNIACWELLKLRLIKKKTESKCHHHPHKFSYNTNLNHE